MPCKLQKAEKVIIKSKKINHHWKRMRLKYKKKATVKVPKAQKKSMQNF